jgi:hypothetical protein
MIKRHRTFAWKALGRTNTWSWVELQYQAHIGLGVYQGDNAARMLAFCKHIAFISRIKISPNAWEVGLKELCLDRKNWT